MVLSWSGSALGGANLMWFCCAAGSACSRRVSTTSPISSRPKGSTTKVAGHLTWSAEVAEILKERAAGKTGPLVLVGHSQGANNVIDMARSLESHQITVDLLVTLTPFMQNTVPGNVVKAVNYYNSRGWGQPLVGDSGFRGKIVNIDLANDPNITTRQRR